LAANREEILECVGYAALYGSRIITLARTANFVVGSLTSQIPIIETVVGVERKPVVDSACLIAFCGSIAPDHQWDHCCVGIVGQ
jgi:hypothetical protein